MFRANVRLKILLVAVVLLLAAGSTAPAEALPTGVRAVATRTTMQKPGSRLAIWLGHIRTRLARYAMAAD